MTESTNGHGVDADLGFGQPGETNLSHGPVELPLTKADFSSDQETRWCPGCGDYAILASVQGFMPELGIPPEKIVFVTGIGCAGRFVYYMDTYGMHGIHGRAPALATGVATSRPDLSVWVVSGDGDALSIGGNHLIHALRRNVPLKILLFNNQIYGLTKGQYSPTSEEGKVTKSTPFGSQDHPVQPGLAGARRRGHLRGADGRHRQEARRRETLRAAAAHQGTAFVEIYQNCNVFNDGAFDAVRAKGQKELNQIRLEHGQPIRFGAEGERGVARGSDGRLELVDVAEVGEDALLVHDAERPEPSLAFELAHLAARPTGPDAHRRLPLGASAPSTGPSFARRSTRRARRSARRELEALLHSGRRPGPFRTADASSRPRASGRAAARPPGPHAGPPSCGARVAGQLLHQLVRRHVVGVAIVAVKRRMPRRRACAASRSAKGSRRRAVASRRRRRWPLRRPRDSQQGGRSVRPRSSGEPVRQDPRRPEPRDRGRPLQSGIAAQSG